MKKTILPLLLLSVAMPAMAQKMYKVDSSYGTNGISLTTPSSSSTIHHIEMNAVHLQDDGKVWEGGRVFFTGDTYWSTTIQKRIADGTRDVSYSGDGVKISEYQTDNQVLAMMPLKGDKMYAAVTGYGGYVARPDTAMISQIYHGAVLAPYDAVYCAVRYNDSIIIEGAQNGGIIFYKDNGIGTSTNNYANSGYKEFLGIKIGTADYEFDIKALAVQPDGKYLAAGALVSLVKGGYSKFAFIARFKPGYAVELDSTFGVNGVQTIGPSVAGTNGTPYVACMAIEPSGSIIANVIGRDSSTGTAMGQQGMRFNANGTFRENFALPNARKLIVNSDGKIFALGNTGSVFCINPDGSFYTNFFGGAKALDMAEFPSGAVGHLGRDMSMNASGDIVIVGYYNQSSTGTHSFTRKFTSYTPTSIKNVAAIEGLKLYPNPNNGVFTIEVKQDANIKVMNVLGQVVLEQQLPAGAQELNITNAANGLYFVKITSGNQQQTISIVKQ